MTRSAPLPFALLVGLLSASCGPHLKIDGRVVGCEDKKPIPSAEVKYTYAGLVGDSASQEHSKTTDKDGRFHLGAVNYSEETAVRVRVEAKGRKPVEQTYQGSQAEEQTLCLPRE